MTSARFMPPRYGVEVKPEHRRKDIPGDYIGPVWPFSISPAQMERNRAAMIAGVEAERAYLAKRAIREREHGRRVEQERERQAKRAKRRDSTWRALSSLVLRAGVLVLALWWLWGVLSRL